MKNYVTTYDPFFDFFFQPIEKKNHAYLMDTDIIEKHDHYEMKVNLPYVNKEDVKVKLEEGYLTISVTENKENNEENTSYILKERTTGSYSRDYYVGEDVKLSDISGKLEHGVLTLNIKKVNKVEKEQEKYIQIQ